MVNLYKNNPTWKETKLFTATEDDIEQLKYEHELLLDPNKFTIYFWGKATTLEAQQYKFLKAVLTKNGNRISAQKIMKEIKSECKPEIAQTLSYRIKSKIKTKLKKLNITKIPVEDNEWILLDKSYAPIPTKMADNKVFHEQIFDFERAFNQLISVKDGYYYTIYQKD